MPTLTTKHNPIQFSVVREDPEIEKRIILSTGAKNILLIASGGCTALSLQSYFPEIKITLVDPNSAQIALVQEKMKALEGTTPKEREVLFNVQNSSPLGLNENGNFESLFRSFRAFVNEFIMSSVDLEQLLTQEHQIKNARSLLFQHRYWKVAFDLFFHHSLLETMFGPAAVQHAPKGSYPDYFRNRIEMGLEKQGAHRNYFIHHLFLGHYVDDELSLPHYLTSKRPEYQFYFMNTTVDKIKDFSSFDLIHLSNIFDWMDEGAVQDLVCRLGTEMKLGASLFVRQLNNKKDFLSYAPLNFQILENESHDFLVSDRSLFYSNIIYAVRVGRHERTD